MLANANALSALLYDGSTPPEDFVKLFKLTAVFQDWNEAAQLANLTYFLKGRASRVLETGAKATIAEAIKTIVEGCAISEEASMAKFFARHRQEGESMASVGQALRDLLKAGMPGCQGATELAMLKMQL